MFSRPYSVNKLRRNQSYRRALLEQLEDRRLLAANIAPVNSVPAEVQTTQVNTPIAFTDFRDNRISTSDADSGAHRVRTTLTAAHGVVTLIYPDPTGGLTYSVGDGTNDPTMTFTGKVNDINQALRWIAFQPEADYVGSEATLTITTNDHGHFGTGGAKSDTDTVAITVTAVPDFEASPTWTTFPGALDTSFDTDGMQVLSVSAGIDFINDMTLLDDGKILAVGSVNNHYGLMRFNSDLTLDTTFGTNGVTETNLGTNRHINTMIFDKQGRIIVGGGTYLARYSVDGVLDTSFGSDALGNATGLIRNIHVMQINDLAIQPDGKLLAMGRDNADFRITRYLQDGTVDPVFGNRNYNVGGRHANDFGRGLTVRDDGDILLIGRGAQSTAFSLQRINTYGGKELQTRVDLPGDNEFVNDILELPDGKILVIGSTGSSGGKDFAVTRHHFDGTLDTTFATVGKLRIPVLNSADQGYRATLQPDGKILISGSSYNGSNWDLSIARISYDGVLDATFAGDGTRGIPDFTGANDYGHAVLSMPDGKILIAGRSGNKISLIRLLGDFNMNSTEAPTLNEINDLNVLEDAPQQTVNLAGITDGDDGEQPLQVTAASNNTLLLANPTVVYTSPNATGTLSFTPLADKFGVTTITVTVTDGGADKNLATTGDNLTTSRTFDVTVNPVNDEPTLIQPDDLTIDEDAPRQTVNLNGITAGGGETQNLAVTAVSSNTSLIADPMVVYSSANATGRLKFTPLADQNGTATITVTVTDGGLDNDLATTDDNLTTSHTFDVTVNPVNDDPTLNSLVDLTIEENSSQKTVNLTGVTAGGGETQNLAVTAVSSNTSLIANPTVVYTSANSTGSLKFTPLADQNGSTTTTITVTVEDGGLDNNLATTGDNATTSESFDVVVAAIFPWHNKVNPLDINDDGATSSIDVLVVINELNSNGSYQLPKPRSGTGAPYYDVNQDGQLTPSDPLQIINHLNETDGHVVFSFDITNVNDDILSQIEVGDHFFVSMYTQDTRSTAYGVFAAYLDMYYDARLVAPVGTPVNTAPFANGASASFATAGVVDEWGVFADVNQTGSERLLVSTIQFKALAAGTNLFGSDSADIIPLHDVLLHGTNTPVPPSLIQFGSTSIAIVEADNGDGEGEDFFTRDGLQLLSNDNYLTDELENTLDLLLGTTTTN